MGLTPAKRPAPEGRVADKYATKVRGHCGAVLSVARALGHRRIEASHFLDNPASGRVLRKLGFTPTGEHRLRRSEGRGTVVTTVVHQIDLGEAGNGDGGGDDREPMRRAA